MSERPLTGLAGRVEGLRANLAQRDLSTLAAACGATVVDGCLQMEVWGTAVTLSTPEFVARAAETGEAFDLLTQALVAYYLHTADGFPPADQWIAFTELPDGRFYTQAFQGYTGR